MDIKIKAVLAIVPFGAAVAIAMTMAMPAWDEYSNKVTQVEGKKSEQEQLQTKLNGKTKLQREKKLIEDQLAMLKDNIPSKPDLQILNLDLEKMCNEAGLDLIAFKEADKEALKKAGIASESEEVTDNQNSLKKQVKGNIAKATAGTTGGNPGTPGAKKDKDKEVPDAGLKKVYVEVKAIGDYAGLLQLARKLETYQRVVQITEVRATIPGKAKNAATKDLFTTRELPDDNVPAEGDLQGDHKRLNLGFLLAAYYQPQ